MKKLVSYGIGILAIFFALSVQAIDSKDLVGHYDLQGEAETSGSLNLNANQKYSASFTYSGNDWVEEGEWKVEDDELVLSDGHFKDKNHPQFPLYLSSGMSFEYRDGKLTSGSPQRRLLFTDTSRTK